MNKKVNMISQILVAVFVIATVTGISSCEKNTYTPPTINPVDSVHFDADVQPIFNSICLSCHGAVKAPDLRDGYSYAYLTTHGYVTLPGETSPLYVKLIGTDHSPRTSDIQKQKILIWINQGAHNN